METECFCNIFKRTIKAQLLEAAKIMLPILAQTGPKGPPPEMLWKLVLEQHSHTSVKSGDPEQSSFCYFFITLPTKTLLLSSLVRPEMLQKLVLEHRSLTFVKSDAPEQSSFC